MKIGVFTILSVLLFLGAKGKEVPDVIHAKKIVLRGRTGQAILEPFGLYFLDATPEAKNITTYYGDGSLEIRTTDKNDTLIYIGRKTSDGEEVPALRMFSGDGRSMAFLTMNQKGESSLLFRTNMKERVVLGETELKDTKTGSTIIRPPTSLVFMDEKGKVVWSAP